MADEMQARKMLYSLMGVLSDADHDDNETLSKSCVYRWLIPPLFGRFAKIQENMRISQAQDVYSQGLDT